MGDFGIWFIGLVVCWAWLSPAGAGEWAAKCKAAFDAEAAKMRAGKR